MAEMRRSSSGTTVELKPQLDNITPSRGPIGGDQQVTITGTGLANIVRILFGGEEATDIVATGATKVVCTTPSNAHGPCKVFAINAENMESNRLSYTFE